MIVCVIHINYVLYLFKIFLNNINKLKMFCLSRIFNIEHIL